MFGDKIPGHFGKICNFLGPLAAALLGRFYSFWLFRSNFNAVLGTLFLLAISYPANKDLGALSVVCGLFVGLAIRDYTEKEWEPWITTVVSLVVELVKCLYEAWVVWRARDDLVDMPPLEEVRVDIDVTTSLERRLMASPLLINNLEAMGEDQIRIGRSGVKRMN